MSSQRRAAGSPHLPLAMRYRALVLAGASLIAVVIACSGGTRAQQSVGLELERLRALPSPYNIFRGSGVPAKGLSLFMKVELVESRPERPDKVLTADVDCLKSVASARIVVGHHQGDVLVHHRHQFFVREVYDKSRLKIVSARQLVTHPLLLSLSILCMNLEDDWTVTDVAKADGGGRQEYVVRAAGRPEAKVVLESAELSVDARTGIPSRARLSMFGRADFQVHYTSGTFRHDGEVYPGVASIEIDETEAATTTKVTIVDTKLRAKTSAEVLAGTSD